jgi:hypothetical protein
MPFLNANLPSGFAVTSQATRTKVVLSISEAETLGITEGGANEIAILWYHVDQYFKKKPRGKLWIYLIDSTAIAYNEHKELQNYAEGEIRQVGFYDGSTAFATANLTTIQASCTTLETENKPLSVIYAGDTTAIADIATLEDLRALSNKNVSVVIGEDGGNDGKALAASEGQSITCLGAVLGVVSLQQVHQNIGWVQEFNIVDGDEFDEPGLSLNSTTVLVKDQTETALDSLNDKGYIFITKHVGIDGTYFNDSPTAVPVTSDYAYIENNRTIDKAVRGVRTNMLPNLQGPLYVNDDGTLTEDVISRYKNDASRALESMEREGEVSAYEIIINPEQNVLTTSKVVVTVKIVPVGVAREIVVNIGFAVKVQS